MGRESKKEDKVAGHPVALSCNPSYSGGRDQEDLGKKHHKKRAAGVAQVEKAPA
jgi:hypothetical protein